MLWSRPCTGLENPPVADCSFDPSNLPRQISEPAAAYRGKHAVTDLQRLVLLALQASVFCIVFGFGLKTAPNLVSLLRRPMLLARSLVAVFVLMPLVAILPTLRSATDGGDCLDGDPRSLSPSVAAAEAFAGGRRHITRSGWWLSFRSLPS